MQEIEENLKERRVNIDDIELIQNTRISTAEEEKAFDPSYTAFLFEKGVNKNVIKDKTNWFFFGPVKWITIKTVEIFSKIERVLSINRVKAFYLLINELTFQTNRINSLEKRVEQLLTENLELKKNLSTQPEFSLFLNLNSENNFERRSLNTILPFFNKQDHILLLLPAWGEVIEIFRNKGLSYSVITDNLRQYNYIKKNIDPAVKYVEDIFDLGGLENFNKVFLALNLCFLPSWYINRLLNALYEKISSGTKVFFRFQNEPSSNPGPFSEKLMIEIEMDSLIPYLRNIGFINILHQNIPENEYDIISFYKP